MRLHSSVRGRRAFAAVRERSLFPQMKHRFDKHYTREEANALLPQIRKWLERLNRLREDLHRCEKRLSGLTGQGNDIGGETVNNWIRTLADGAETRPPANG